MRAWIATFLALVLTACAASPQSVAQDNSMPVTAAKRIAFTFDDTPRHAGAFFTEDERTRLMIKALRDGGARQGAFFINPGKIPERPGAEARIAAYIEAGHVIANHTFSHPRLSRTETGEYIADIDQASQWLSGREGTRAWFRYPYLDEGRNDKSKRDAVRDALKARGLINASPTVDASDWWIDSALGKAEREGKAYDQAAAGRVFVEVHVEAAEFYNALALETYDRPIVHNILLHETDLSALFLGDLIAALKEAGWTIVTADEAFADPVYKGAPDVPSAQGTLVELAAWHKGIGSQRWYPGNDTKLLEKRFNEQVLGKDEQ
ncbi:MAG: polysaccharide deacetylase family protein [Pseudomonadota bacterium]